MSYSVDSLPFAHGDPLVSGVIRSTPEDFFVDEIPLVEPDGEGEHLLVWVEKRDANTEWVARRLAQLAGLRTADVGFAGMKDRFAVTRQWFSLHLGNRETPEFAPLEGEGIRVLSTARHGRKLRRGALKGNRFRLVVRQLEGAVAALGERLAAIAARGVPNYFGEQRFGREGNNLLHAEAMFGGRRVKDRHKRGIYLSAARSRLFNEVLAARVAEGSWDRPLAGEVLVLDGSGSHFVAETIDEEILRRVAVGDLHPSGPMWGRGRPLPGGEALALEERLLAGWATWRDGLEHAGLKQERRPLRLPVGDLRWSFEGSDGVVVEFSLPAGGYATGVLREWVRHREAERDERPATE
ncbi:tRNA pseudouridine(13) synthase TruD [Endothiovibrio diazotrophicus]